MNSTNQASDGRRPLRDLIFEAEHLVRGPASLADGRPVPTAATALDMFARHVAQRPGATAIIFGDREITWSQIDRASSAVADWLIGQRIAPGERAAVQLQNCPQFIIALLAIWKAGGIAVVVGPMYKADETRQLLQLSGARVLITDPEIWAASGRAAIDGTSVARVVTTSAAEWAGGEQPDSAVPSPPDAEAFADILAAGSSTPRLRGPEPQDLALMAFTSGTTGPAKATLTRHGNLAAAFASWTDGFGVGERRHVQLSVAPYVHITGIVGSIGAWLWSGSTLVIMGRFEAGRALDLIERHRCTWLVGAATVFTALLKEQESSPRDVTSLERFPCGGAPIPGVMAERVRSVLGAPLQPGYGMTESTTLATLTPAGEDARVNEEGVVSVGPPGAGTGVAILAEDGRLAAPGERGEVLLSGLNVIGGYWEAEAATAETFESGWLRTGDIGYLDEDGWLYIVDRIKNLIIASGYKVWPREVEEVLYRHPSVRETAVIGVPDAYRGETVKAFVSLRSDADVDAEELRQFARERLAAYKAPKLVEIMDELPKNANGKIQPTELRRLEAERRARAEAEAAGGQGA